jgi:glycosyltransferase involved in cell wall biosynthesis
MMKAVQQESLTTWFADLIRALKPTVVHTHHYAHLGLEYLRVTKLVDPEIRIYMTLHEYMAICRNNGQMIKANGHALCSRESFDECHQCFPEKTVEDFWLRKHYFQRQFDLIDGFFAPSEFLRQRYIEWGLSPDRIVVCENGQAKEEPLPPRPLGEGETRNRFGFFGQITPYKGLDVVLEALNDTMDTQLLLEVHGANLEFAAQDFRERVEGLCAPLMKNRRVQWMGPYQASELRARMSGIDWVLVPSIWWENSPLVIQEAYKYGRPVICSDIGGMAEKVKNGVTGMHFHARNPAALAAIMKRCVQEDSLWNKICGNLPVPMTIEASVQTHVQVFAAH